MSDAFFYLCITYTYSTFNFSIDEYEILAGVFCREMTQDLRMSSPNMCLFVNTYTYNIDFNLQSEKNRRLQI